MGKSIYELERQRDEAQLRAENAWRYYRATGKVEYLRDGKREQDEADRLDGEIRRLQVQRSEIELRR